MNSTSTTAEQLQELILQLQNKKQEIQNQKSPIEIARENFERQWGTIEQSRINNFRVYLEKLQPLIQLEHGIIESVRGFIPDDTLQELQLGFPKIRNTNNLQNLNGIYHMYRDDVKMRNVLKLIFTVYRYNRDILFDDTDTNLSTLKSRIKHASLCPHCGEVAKQILMNMMETKMVLLPD